MKLKQYIKELREFEKLHGNLDVIYSSDDEGNSYSPVLFVPTPVKIKKITHYMQSEDMIFDTDDFNAVIIN